nr:TPA: hypothetical protein BN1204_028440 [Neospora caninum Liverpool]
MRLSGREPLLDIQAFLKRHPDISVHLEDDGFNTPTSPDTPNSKSQSSTDVFALAKEIFTPDISASAAPAQVWDELVSGRARAAGVRIKQLRYLLKKRRTRAALQSVLYHVAGALLLGARTAHLARELPLLQRSSVFFEVQKALSVVWNTFGLWTSAVNKLEELLLRHAIDETTDVRRDAAAGPDGEEFLPYRLKNVETATSKRLRQFDLLKLVLDSIEEDEHWRTGPRGIDGQQRLQELLWAYSGGQTPDDFASSKSSTDADLDDSPALGILLDADDSDSTISATSPILSPQIPEAPDTLDQAYAISSAPQDEQPEVPVWLPTLDDGLIEEALTLYGSDDYEESEGILEGPFASLIQDGDDDLLQQMIAELDALEETEGIEQDGAHK